MRLHAVCAALIACASAPPAADPRPALPQGVPALVVDPTLASRAALSQAVTDLQDGRRPAILADDALTKESLFYLERTPRYDPEGHRLDGRDRSVPESFRLLKSGDDCVLVREKTGRFTFLVATKCAPLR